ncbi:hypothetical protein GCM10022630_09170 [Thermobifida alba]
MPPASTTIRIRSSLAVWERAPRPPVPRARAVTGGHTDMCGMSGGGRIVASRETFPSEFPRHTSDMQSFHRRDKKQPAEGNLS